MVCHLLFRAVDEGRGRGCVHTCSDTGDNEDETTPLSAFPTLKVSSGPEHDSRQQQIDKQNTGILARWMDCEQGLEVGNGFLSHPVKHLQVANVPDVLGRLCNPSSTLGYLHVLRWEVLRNLIVGMFADYLLEDNPPGVSSLMGDILFRCSN